MQKSFLLVLIVLTVAGGVPIFYGNSWAQSGRRGLRPPPVPTPEQLSEPPIVVSSPENESTPLSAVGALPENFVNRQIRGLDDSSFSLADFSGKVLVINIWATWCGPCRREAPEYEKVRKEFAGRAVEFIALTTEDPRTSTQRVKQFVHDFNFGFRLGFADRQTAGVLMNGRNVIPQTLVIGSDGRIVSHWQGYSPRQGGGQLREILRQLATE
jgi:thiol-disulfide isomerase/thioredoxin